MRETSATSPTGWTVSAGFGPGDSALLKRLLYVAFFLEVGLLLIVLPWSGFWERNYFVASFPALRTLVSNNFVRGGVTGLGVVNLVTGFVELLPVFTARERRELRGIDQPAEAPTLPANPDV